MAIEIEFQAYLGQRTYQLSTVKYHRMLTPTERLSATLQLREEFRTRDGAGFQALFADIMARKYRNDFDRVCPWGRDGDRKNDGYLRSERKLFQCYAPRRLGQGPTLEKVHEDFHGALPHWQAHFDEWVLVHNETDGTPAFLEQSLLDLSTAHAPLRLVSWGFDQVRDLLLTLPRQDVVDIVGELISDEVMASLEFQDIAPVLEYVAGQEVPHDLPIVPVPADKLNANLLSEDVKQWIKFGLRKAPLIRQTIDRHYDSTLGDRVAEAFREKYNNLKSLGLTGDRIFDELKVFAGFPRTDSRRQAATLALLSHLFESCDIFESPRELIAPMGSA